MTLPPNWQEKFLRDVVTFSPRHGRELLDDLDVSFVPMPTVNAGRRDLLPHETRKLGHVRRGYTHFRNGDVLFAKITPCMENGKAAVARDLINGVGCGTTELHVLRPAASVLPEWVYFYIWQGEFRKEAERNMTGSAGQLRVPLSFLEKQKIPVPDSIDEQRRITKKLDSIIARLDETKLRLDTIPTILKRFRMSVLAAACAGRLAGAEGEVGDECQFGSAIEEMRNGISRRPDFEGPGNRILRISAVRPGNVNLNDCRFLKKPSLKEEALCLREGDLLFTRYNGNVDLVGVCGVVRGLSSSSILYPDKLIRVRLLQTVHPEWAEIYFSAPSARERIVSASKSSAGQNGISGSDIKELPFVVPPMKLQLQIIRRVQALFEQAASIEARCRKANDFNNHVMTSVLAKAFCGELA